MRASSVVNADAAQAFLERRRPSIAIVDDDVEVRAALRHVLMQLGCAVIEAGDGASALELLAAAADARRMPDVLILDVKLPELSGLSVLQSLQTFPAPPRVLTITGFRDDSIVGTARRFGAVRVLHKPLDLGALFIALADAVG